MWLDKIKILNEIDMVVFVHWVFKWISFQFLFILSQLFDGAVGKCAFSGLSCLFESFYSFMCQSESVLEAKTTQ